MTPKAKDCVAVAGRRNFLPPDSVSRTAIDANMPAKLGLELETRGKLYPATATQVAGRR